MMSKRVLLIEDFPVIQNLYGEALGNHGFHVDIAADGAIALEKVKETNYDFIFYYQMLMELNF
jgi:DNA-binding response OmpR family regulator